MTRDTSSSQMHLAMILQGSGNHKGSWRRATSRIEDTFAPAFYVEAVQRAERAKIDAVFFADSPYIDPQVLRSDPPINAFEPMMLCAYLASVTSHIGLVTSVSTTFTPPYTLARQFASLDRLSGGRAGWNIVTSAFGERNYGDQPLPDQKTRYEMAAEALEAAKRLWDGWDPSSLKFDREAGIFADVSDIRRADFKGAHYQVEGPLNVLRPTQGWPVLFQAGASPTGRNFAARHAEVTFTAEQTLEGARDFRLDVKARAAAAGRDPDRFKVLPGLTPIVGATMAEALEIQEELAKFLDLKTALRALSSYMQGVDLQELDLDRPIPPEFLPEVAAIQGRQSRYALYRQLTVDDGWTLRQLAQLQGRSDGHWTITGDPEYIADQMAERFLAGAGDGYVVMPTHQPEGAALFLERVVPILQDKGLSRRDYSATTLRGHFGLDVPAR